MTTGDLVLALLLGCRERGMARLDDTKGRLHSALLTFVGAHGDEVRALCGSKPALHPFFGTYQEIDYALDELGLMGALECQPPAWTTFAFLVTPADAEGLIRKHAGEVPAALIDAFVEAVRREEAGS